LRANSRCKVLQANLLVIVQHDAIELTGADDEPGFDGAEKIQELEEIPLSIRNVNHRKSFATPTFFDGFYAAKPPQRFPRFVFQTRVAKTPGVPLLSTPFLSGPHPGFEVSES
jgi:hypothetical protein